jgi:hypothetical protein
LKQLATLRDRTGTASERLHAVLDAYGLIVHASRGHRGGELAEFLHRSDQVPRAQEKLRALIRDLLSEAQASGELRNDVAAEELASYCMHALTAAGGLPSAAAVRRLVTVTFAGLRPPL